MARYFVDDVEVDRAYAVRVWHGSSTYRAARPRTRGYIFITAEKGDNASGEVQHLAEAGIRIEPDLEGRSDG